MEPTAPYSTPYVIVGYVSSYPGSVPWVVSGKPADVDALQAEVVGLDGARLIARAEDGSTAFARFELPTLLPFKVLGGLIFNAQRRRLVIGSPLPYPLFSDGREEAIGDPDARQPIAAIIGSTEAVEAAKETIPWANTFPVWLDDDRTGCAFRPTSDRLDDYRTFIASAASGAFTDVDVVLVETLY